MKRYLRPLAVALIVLATAAVSTVNLALAQFSPAQRGEIEKIIRDYLLRNPEILQEVVQEMEKRQAVADAEKHRDAIKKHAEALFNSKRQVVLGNPQGDVTMVEFFDYNCGFCRKALTDKLELVRADPKLRLVLKEFPVLGEGSTQAAQVAVAVRMQDKTSGKKYLEFHQKMFASRGQVDKTRALAVVREIGFDAARAERDMNSDEVRLTLEEDFKLAEALGINGTPTYVFDGHVVVGAVGVEKLREAINTVRCGKATC
ncbi:MAG: thioredoxin domain-containing protein [Rhizobiales bacterium]|nr:thioredoxin domain-containing protein [Hyphomicrobiales bacterium]